MIALMQNYISVNFDSIHPVKSLSNFIFVILFLRAFISPAQSLKQVPPIFRKAEPISLQVSFAFKEVEKSWNDTIYFPSYLKYKERSSVWDSLPVGIRARGNFRRRNCFFAPLRLKIKKPNAEGTPFEGNKSFKLVLPCQGGKSGNTLILKEYICYKLLEPVTPYFFHTRLTDITITDQKEKHSKSYSLTGFLIEDDDLIAHRLGGRVIEQIIPSKQLNDTAAVVNDFFEFMIANTDYSTTGQHNAKVIQLTPSKYVPLSYDFDMAGLVNAPYATINETLNIKSVQERLYRGYCRNEPLMEYVRSEYLRQEADIINVLMDHQSLFGDGEFIRMKYFIEEFFTVLKSDRQFRDSILLSCRTE